MSENYPTDCQPISKSRVGDPEHDANLIEEASTTMTNVDRGKDPRESEVLDEEEVRLQRIAEELERSRYDGKTGQI